MARLTLDNIIDVTLRDGGYLNQWQFSNTEITSIIEFVLQQGIHKIEIGHLRSPENATSLVNGCPTDFLAELRLAYPAMEMVCMLNPEEDWQTALEAKVASIDMVRIPCTDTQIESALAIAEYLHTQSTTIKVSINLICISSYSPEEIRELLTQISSSPWVDIIYFADSRGALYPNEIAPIIALGTQLCHQPLGFHAHDTLGNAIENSNHAFASGCHFIDVTLNGFGLCGGNTSLAAYLEHNALSPADAKLEDKVVDFVTKNLSLTHDDGDKHYLYQMLARKNIDPIWSDKLVEKYPQGLQEIIHQLPRKNYKDLQSVIGY